MRYLWDSYHQYVRGNDLRGLVRRTAFAGVAHYMRMWDLSAAARVDQFVANSRNVASRIRKHYRRNATVVYPPVDTERGRICSRRGDYYLVVGRLVDYKRVDLAIEACTRLSRRLRVVGDGPQFKRLRKLGGRQVEFLGSVSDNELWEQYSQCRALLFPGEEDFGMVPVEAQACGRPVIAFGCGGVLESVVGVSATDGVTKYKDATGIFFTEQTVESVVSALLQFEQHEERFSPIVIATNAMRFSTDRFRQDMFRQIQQSYPVEELEVPVFVSPVA